MITSKDNEIIKCVSKLLSSSSYRREQKCFVAEGARLCMDGVLSGAVAEVFLYTKNGMEKYSQEFEKILSASQRNFEISEPLFKKISLHKPRNTAFFRLFQKNPKKFSKNP